MAVMMSTMMFVMVPRAVVSSERIGEVLDTRTSVVPPAQPAQLRTGPDSRPGLLELRGVEFRYPGAERAVLHGVDLVAEPGKTTAIIGSTGAGKTTLLNLVPRLFDVTGGEVLIDGVDVRDARAPTSCGARSGSSRRSRTCSPAPSRSNLEYGRPGATDEELWHALEVAQARDFVEALDEGLDAPIAQGGTNVSGGQRQRLAIARALVRRPNIYLFDDSFSALDYATDSRLRAALGPGDPRGDRAGGRAAGGHHPARRQHRRAGGRAGGRRRARTPSCWSRRRRTRRSCTRRSAWRRRHEHRDAGALPPAAPRSRRPAR